MNFKKHDYEIHKSLSSSELNEYLSACFPKGIKVKYNKNLAQDSYYHEESMAVLGTSLAYGGTVLVSNSDKRDPNKSSYIHPSNIHIDLQSIRKDKLKQLGI
jgi:hypothetical protein